MSKESASRLGGTLLAFAIGIFIPALLLGPFLFHGVSFNAISTGIKLCTFGCCAFGLWLFVVSVVVEEADLANVFKFFQGGDAFLLILPFMLYCGTRAIYKRLVRR